MRLEYRSGNSVTAIQSGSSKISYSGSYEIKNGELTVLSSNLNLSLSINNKTAEGTVTYAHSHRTSGSGFGFGLGEEVLIDMGTKPIKLTEIIQDDVTETYETATPQPIAVNAELNAYPEVTVAIKGLAEVDLKDCADKVVEKGDNVIFFVKDAQLSSYEDIFDKKIVRPIREGTTYASIDYEGGLGILYMSGDGQWRMVFALQPYENWDLFAYEQDAVIKPLSDYLQH